MNKNEKNVNRNIFSIYDRLESVRFSSQELDEKFLELQKTLSKIKKKNQESEKPRNVLCVKPEIFDYFLKKLDFILQKFHILSANYEEIISALTLKNTEISLESEKNMKDLQNQHKFDILRLELNYKKLLETQALSYNTKEKEMTETFTMISKDLDKTFKLCRNDLEETSMNFQEIKQNRINLQAKHLFALNEFDKNLQDSIKKIEETQKDLPLKLKTLGKNEDYQGLDVPKANILNNFKDPSLFDRDKLIKFKEMFNRNQTKSKPNEKILYNEPSKLNDTEMESEISVFLANHMNHFQEESRLNISMPKDEGKWDPALDSEKSENVEYSEIKKAFEIFDALNLFEAESLNVLQNFSEKCKENNNLNSIDKSIFKELILQLIKLQKERKSKISNKKILAAKISTKNSQENSPNIHSNSQDLQNHNEDDTNLNIIPEILTQIENCSHVNETNEIEDESKNFIENKSQKISKTQSNDEFFNKKHNKNKDLSLSDLILDSSFLSPATGTKLKFEDYAKNARKDENYGQDAKSNMILIQEVSSNNKSIDSNDSHIFQKTMITNKFSEEKDKGKTMENEFEDGKKYDEILSQMKEKIRKDKLSLSQKDQISFRNKNSSENSQKPKFIDNYLYFEGSGLSDKNPKEVIKTGLHNKHNSEIFRSTPNGSFLNNINSNSESKLSTNIENGSFNAKFPAKFRNNSISCLGTAPTQKTITHSNILQRILKKNPLQTNNSNSFFFSNQTQTKIMTADFNKEVGFLQNIICFNFTEEGKSDSVRSEPIIMPYDKTKCFKISHNFSKILNNKENRDLYNSEVMFNCSFPAAKKINKYKRQIFVRKFENNLSENRKRRKTAGHINKSLEINDGWGLNNNSNLNLAHLKMSYSKKIEKNNFYK